MNSASGLIVAPKSSLPPQRRRRMPTNVSLIMNGTTNIHIKGEYVEGGGKVWELNLCLRMDILTPLIGLRIWALAFCTLLFLKRCTGKTLVVSTFTLYKKKLPS
jgi:hypothetical protein